MINISHKRALYLSLVLIAFGVTMNNTTDFGSLGTVLIALGGFFLIVSFAKKRKLDTKNEDT